MSETVTLIEEINQAKVTLVETINSQTVTYTAQKNIASSATDDTPEGVLNRLAALEQAYDLQSGATIEMDLVSLPAQMPVQTKNAVLNITQMSGDIDLTDYQLQNLTDGAFVKIVKMDDSNFIYRFQKSNFTYRYLNKKGEQMQLVWDAANNKFIF